MAEAKTAAKSEKLKAKSKKKVITEEAKELKDGTTQESVATEVQTTEEPAKEVESSSDAEASTTVVKATAKAGKRSAKAIAEVEEKQAKEERKASDAESEQPKAKSQPQQVRTKLERKAKGFRKSAELIEAGKSYSLVEALELATKTSHVKFDATVELHVRLGVDPRQADQNLRDIVILPAGTGKTVRIAVLADPDGVAAAKKAGADIAGSEEFLQQLDKGVTDFDVLIATPAMMAKLGKYARLLGPKGLMPNPKSGTVTADVAKGVSDAKAGRVEYRVDSTGIVHLGIGKVSFGKDKLEQNGRAVLGSIKGNKPSSIKGTFVKAIHVTTSMGPSISIDIAEI